MAKFSQSFLQSMLMPGLAADARQLGAYVGSIPGLRREQKQKAALQKGLFGLEQMAISGNLDPEMYKEALGSYTALMQQNPKQAEEIRKSLARVGASVREQDKTRKTISAKQQINNLRNAALAVQRSGEVTTEEKERTLALMKQELKKIQEANPNVDLTEFDGMFEDVIVEARQLNRAAALDEREAANKLVSQQIYAVKDLKTLEALEERLLKVDGADAEAIKKYSSIQQRSILDRQERERLAAERGYDVTGDLTSIEKRIDETGVPQKVADLVRAKIAAAEREQNQYMTNGTWTNVAARNKAAALVDQANRLIDEYVIEKADSDLRQIASIESELADLMADGEKDVNPNVVQDVADGMAILDEGKKFNELPPKKQQQIYKKALESEKERLKEEQRRAITSRQRQLAALRGEDIPEKEEQKEEAPKFIDPISKEAVEAARARGQTDAQIRRSLQALGASNEKIVSLL